MSPVCTETPVSNKSTRSIDRLRLDVKDCGVTSTEVEKMREDAHSTSPKMSTIENLKAEIASLRLALGEERNSKIKVENSCSIAMAQLEHLAAGASSLQMQVKLPITNEAVEELRREYVLQLNEQIAVNTKLKYQLYAVTAPVTDIEARQRIPPPRFDTDLFLAQCDVQGVRSFWEDHVLEFTAQWEADMQQRIAAVHEKYEAEKEQLMQQHTQRISELERSLTEHCDTSKTQIDGPCNRLHAVPGQLSSPKSLACSLNCPQPQFPAYQLLRGNGALANDGVEERVWHQVEECVQSEVEKRVQREVEARVRCEVKERVQRELEERVQREVEAREQNEVEERATQDHEHVISDEVERRITEVEQAMQAWERERATSLDEEVERRVRVVTEALMSKHEEEVEAQVSQRLDESKVALEARLKAEQEEEIARRVSVLNNYLTIEKEREIEWRLSEVEASVAAEQEREITRRVSAAEDLFAAKQEREITRRVSLMKDLFAAEQEREITRRVNAVRDASVAEQEREITLRVSTVNDSLAVEEEHDIMEGVSAVKDSLAAEQERENTQRECLAKVVLESAQQVEELHEHLSAAQSSREAEQTYEIARRVPVVRNALEKELGQEVQRRVAAAQEHWTRKQSQEFKQCVRGVENALRAQKDQCVNAGKNALAVPKQSCHRERDVHHVRGSEQYIEQRINDAISTNVAALRAQSEAEYNTEIMQLKSELAFARQHNSVSPSAPQTREMEESEKARIIDAEVHRRMSAFEAQLATTWDAMKKRTLKEKREREESLRKRAGIMDNVTEIPTNKSEQHTEGTAPTPVMPTTDIQTKEKTAEHQKGDSDNVAWASSDHEKESAATAGTAGAAVYDWERDAAEFKGAVKVSATKWADMRHSIGSRARWAWGEIDDAVAKILPQEERNAYQDTAQGAPSHARVQGVPEPGAFRRTAEVDACATPSLFPPEGQSPTAEKIPISERMSVYSSTSLALGAPPLLMQKKSDAISHTKPINTPTFPKTFKRPFGGTDSEAAPLHTFTQSRFVPSLFSSSPVAVSPRPLVASRSAPVLRSLRQNPSQQEDATTALCEFHVTQKRVYSPLSQPSYTHATPCISASVSSMFGAAQGPQRSGTVHPAVTPPAFYHQLSSPIAPYQRLSLPSNLHTGAQRHDACQRRHLITTRTTFVRQSHHDAHDFRTSRHHDAHDFRTPPPHDAHDCRTSRQDMALPLSCATCQQPHVECHSAAQRTQDVVRLP